MWLSIIIGIGLLIWLVVAASQPQTSNLSIDTISDTDWVYGDRQAKVVLLEYSDFQCPACATYHPMVKQLEQEFGQQIAVVYRHFPLSTIHPNARAAAESAEAAGLQGYFWQMHDKLFENQSDWSASPNPRNQFIQYASDLGLDIEKFESDLSSSAVSQAVRDDIVSANQVGINATPTFFLNGVSITNPRSYDAFKNLVSEALLGAE